MDGLAARMDRLGTETAFEVLARARALEAEGRAILHFEMGEPDFDTPPHIIEAAHRALREGWTHYGPAPGLPEVRAAIAAHVARTRGIEVGPQNVVVVPGAKPILFFTILTLVEEGTEVLVPDPSFPIYESVVRAAGGTVVPYALPEERGFNPDPVEIASKCSPRTRLVILNSPGNPTGGVMNDVDMDAFADAVRPSGAWVLTDEIYADFIYEGTHVSLLSRPGMAERSIMVDGFSKSWAMTGWRLGYGVMPEALAARITQWQINCTSCTAPFIQRAGLAALEGPRDFVDGMLEAFRGRRDRIVDGLNAVKGFRCARPRGAFYVFPSVAGTGLKGREMARVLLEEEGIATVAGTAFGPAGEDFIRFSFANSLENIDAAVKRLQSRFGTA